MLGEVPMPMPNPVSTRDRHNTYGVLITVLALVLAVVYSDGVYSGWDALVAGVSTLFAISFLVRIDGLDFMEMGLAAVLLGVSAATLLSAMFAGSDFGALIDANLLLSALLIAAIAVAACLVVSAIR